MDKLKTFWEVVKKHHFWMLLGLIVVPGILIFVTAAAGLKSEYEKREKAIIDSWTQTTAILREDDHPNEESIKSAEEARQKQEDLNNLTWLKLYEEQKKDNRWPKVLGDRFLRVIRELKPDEEISRTYREIYRNRIKEALPELFEIVNYRRQVPREPGETADLPPEAGADAMMGLGLGMSDNFKTIGIVEWNEADRAMLEQAFTWTDMPSTLRIRLAQEDYWVYKALLTIIRDTNGGTETQSGAAVKEIKGLEIGQRAADSIEARKGPSLVAGEPASAGAGAGMGMGMGMEAGMGAPGDAPMLEGGAGGPAFGDPSAMGGTSASGDEDENLMNRRYVKDKHLTPLSAQEAKEQKQFKRMPVRMELVVDQRKIPDLLVQCANATMPVEVVQVRINPDEAGGVPGMGGMMGGPRGGMMGGPRGGMMGGPMMGGPMMGGPAGPAGAAPALEGGGGGGMGGPRGGMMGGPMMGGMAQKEERSPYEVTIEIRGIIYVFRPSPLAEGREEVEKAEDTPDVAASPQPETVDAPDEPQPLPTTP